MAEESSGQTVKCVTDSDNKTNRAEKSIAFKGKEDVEAQIIHDGADECLDDDDLPFPGYVPVAFHCIKQTNILRFCSLKIITWPWFERISMAVIVLNCITLGMYQPCHDSVCDTTRCIVLQWFDHFIFGFFALEMVIKLLAMGLYGKFTYMADTWNRLDCFIVLAGAVEYGVDTENLSLSAIRTIRVLRPLRAINRIPSMRILVMLLLDTLPMLGNVLLLCFFVFFIFGIIGVQLWAGVLRNRCFFNISENITLNYTQLGPYYKPPRVDFICSADGDAGMKLCKDLPRYVYRGLKCNESAVENSDNEPTNTSCVNWNQYYTNCQPGDKNPFQGAISFDNIGLAWVAIFQVISLESWVNIMYYVQDAHSFWDWIYFVALIVIGSFFMINLCLVVIATQFSETKKRETERMMQERKRFQSSSTLASNSEPGGCYAEILKYLVHLWRRGKRKILRTYYQNRGKRQRKINPVKAISLRRKNHRRKGSLKHIHLHPPPHHHYHITNYDIPIVHRDSSPVAPTASPEQSDVDPVSSPRRPNFLTLPGQNNSSLPSTESLYPYCYGAEALTPTFLKSQQSSPNRLAARLSMSRTPSYSGSSCKNLPSLPDVLAIHGAVLAASNTLWNAEYDVNRLHPLTDKVEKRLSVPHLMSSSDLDTYHAYPDETSESEHDSYSDDDWKEDTPNEKKKKRNYFQKFQHYLYIVVESEFFQRTILFFILINTLSMGIEYHDQPEELTEALEYSNIVFSALFAFEMLFKLLALGAFGYISNGFNVFDGFIVTLSIVELAQGGANGLSVLRTFRLLRILKLVRFMPALRRQLVVMLKTMDNVATFFALLLLFMFIFSILGMNLFGCKFCENKGGKLKCNRKNFDSLLWSIITVFQVLTQEDWNTVLYNGMEKTSAWASLYFIALMTFGNYVLFNLLVAILVEGFSSEEEEKKKEKEKEKDKEKQTTENNNNEQDNESNKLKDPDQEGEKNNKEKEKKMMALPPPVSITKEDNLAMPTTDSPLNPPIITHTAATPMATPQGSPNENATKDITNQLAVTQTIQKSTLSVDSADRSSVSLSVRCGSPRPLRRSGSRGSRGSWRLKNRRRDHDKTSLVVDSLSDSGDEGDDDVFSSNASSPYSPGTPRPPSTNNHSDCNGHPPLNNQRTLSPQNSLKGQRVLTPRNSIKSNRGWSRNNSITSNSVCNAIGVSRQNSINSNKTLNSAGSGTPKDEYKPNNLSVDIPDAKSIDKDKNAVEEEDPDAVDETNCNWIKFPEPKGCFLTRLEYSLYLLAPDNKFRKHCHHIVTRKWFDYTVLFFIALNCITLAMERPNIPPKSKERYFLTVSNYIFTVIFSTEMLLKVVAKGMLTGRHAYLKSGWNVMDGFLVIISLVDIVISLSANSSPRIFGILRVFRLLRTLRPLRVISRAPGLKLVVQTLLSSLRPIGNIVLICCTFFIIFAILGVQLFKGTFFYCKGPTAHMVSNRTECELNKKNHWVNQKYNFDNIGQALMALFVLASKDGWVSIMHTGLDAVGVDQQPIENHNEWLLLYFISFLLLVGFFVLNMFVGVVVENFHKCRESQELEERAQRATKRAQKREKKLKSEAKGVFAGLRMTPYFAEYSRPRLLIHTVISSKYFDLAIAGVIGLNVITMAMEFYMMPAQLKFALKIFNYFFTSVFILEAAMKIVALSFMRYIKDSWNQLDIIIVLLSIVGIILEEMETNVIPINPTIIRVMRVLRIARVLKLLKMAKGIRALLDTVIQALPQVGNLGLLFFLLFFIFAALGVELFGRLECSEIHICEGLGEHAHFRNFGMAFLTLFRVATGDNWNGIMKDTLRVDCDGSDNCIWNCCVSSIIAPVYFVIFVLMAQFVLVNVVVAVLMKHLEETYKFNEIEEEVRLEILAIQKQQKRDVQESHKQAALDLEDEEFFAAPISETGVLNNENKEDPESVEQVPDEIPDECVTNEETKNPVSLPTNFTFNLRPPSPDQKTQNSKEGFPASIPMVTINFDGSPERISRCSGAASPSVIYSQSSAKKQSKQKPYKLRRSPVTRSQSCKQRHSRSLHSSIPNIRRIADNQQHASSQPSLNVPKGRWAGVAVVEDHSPTPSRLKRCNTEKTGRVAGRPFLKRRNVKSQEEVSLTNEDSLDNGSDDYCEDSLMNDWLDDEAECDEEVKLITGDDEDDDICPTLSLYNVADPRQSTDPLLSKTDSKQTMDQRLLSQPVIDNRDRLLTRPIINERLMPARPLIDGRERGANRSLFCDSERLVARPLLDDTDSLVTLPLLDDRPRSALPSNDDEVFYSICDNDAEESPDDCGDDDLLLEGINDNTILPPDDSETDASCLRHRHTSSSSVTSISNQEEMPSILDIPDPRTNSNHLRSDECV